jgi:HemX protein
MLFADFTAFMDRLLLLAALLGFLASFGYTLYALGAGRFTPGRVNFLAIFAGFLCLTGFLYLRGQAEKSCPINSLFDVLIFQSWALVLIYLLVGPTYRLSLLGAFTAPLAFFLILTALLAPIRSEPVVREVLNPWVEMHAALSVIAYGAFGLAGIAGVMYLVQERQLKRHKASPLLYNLPPITDLAVANRRLVWLGFGLLTAGFAAGFASAMPVNTVKFGTSLTLWVFYGLLLALTHLSSLGPRRIAGLSVGIFAVAMAALPAIQHLSAHRP